MRNHFRWMRIQYLNRMRKKTARQHSMHIRMSKLLLFLSDSLLAVQHYYIPIQDHIHRTQLIKSLPKKNEKSDLEKNDKKCVCKSIEWPSDWMICLVGCCRATSKQRITRKVGISRADKQWIMCQNCFILFLIYENQYFKWNPRKFLNST